MELELDLEGLTGLIKLLLIFLTPFFLRTLHWEKNQKIKRSDKTMGLQPCLSVLLSIWEEKVKKNFSSDKIPIKCQYG